MFLILSSRINLHLENSRGEIHDLRLLNHTPNALHKSQMRRIFLQIVFSVLFVLEFYHENMGQTTLKEGSQLEFFEIKS
jgi:hypothetical protein